MKISHFQLINSHTMGKAPAATTEAAAPTGINTLYVHTHVAKMKLDLFAVRSNVHV